MRELIRGVTKIRSIGNYQVGDIFGKGVLTYRGMGDPLPIWESEKGEIFEWGAREGEGRYWEFVDEDESPKLKVGDTVGIKSLAYVGVVEDIDEVEYSISVRWEDGTLGCYDEDVLVKRGVSKPQEDSPVSQHISKLAEVPKVMHETTWSGVHYDKYYHLTPEDIAEGKIRLDAYTVAKVWKIGSKDDSGALFHTFKLFPRWGEKNTVEREIVALYNQAKALARVYNVKLEDK